MIIADFKPGNVSFLSSARNFNLKELESKIQFFMISENNDIDHISYDNRKITFHFKKEISDQAEEDLEEFLYQTRNKT